MLALDRSLAERTEPFQLFRGQHLLDAAQLTDLLAALPSNAIENIAVEDPAHEKQYRMNLVNLVELDQDSFDLSELSAPWQRLVAELRGETFTRWMEEQTGIALRDVPRSIGLYTHRSGDYLSVHKDKPTKAITVILYLNDEWPAEAGGCFQIFDDPRGEPVAEIAPAGGQLLAFPPTDRSWHAVSLTDHPEGIERVTVQIEYWLSTELAGSAYRPAT